MSEEEVMAAANGKPKRSFILSFKYDKDHQIEEEKDSAAEVGVQV